MKLVLQDSRRFTIRFDKGEDVVKGIEDFMAQQNITACAFYGIGAAAEIELGFFNINLKDYRRKPFFEEFEIISFMGNGSLAEGKPTLHCHGSFGRTDFTVVGGHVFKMVVSVTCEIFLICMDGKIERGESSEFNLKLLN